MRGVAAEDRLVGRLVRPAGRGREGEDGPAHERGEGERAEARPHDLARPRVAVHLGEDVAEDVADREEQDAGAEGEAADLGHLGRPDEVGAEQHRHEGRHHEVVVAVAAVGVGAGAAGVGSSPARGCGPPPRRLARWWALKDSNLRLPPCEGGTLPLS